MESVAKEIETDRAAAEKPDLSPLICFAAFGSDKAFERVSDELVRQGRWYDLGDAARRTNDWKRFKELADVAAKARFWGTLINARHNEDERSKKYAANLIRDNATIADVEKAAQQSDWTVVGCIFDWCRGETRDLALAKLVERGLDYFTDEKVLVSYLKEDFIKRNGWVGYLWKKAHSGFDRYALMREYRESRGMK